MATADAGVKQAARIEVGKAVRRGGLPAPRQVACVGCGQPAAAYHHPRGYDEAHALDVEPLCPGCHRARHPVPPNLGRTFPDRRPQTRGRPIPGLRRLREAAPMTQGELAQAAGVGRITVARLEAGKGEARPSTIRALAKALGTTAAALMAEVERDAVQ